MVMRIKSDNVCEVLIALFLANNLPWIDDRYCYDFIEYLTSCSCLGIFFKVWKRAVIKKVLEYCAGYR